MTSAKTRWSIILTKVEGLRCLYFLAGESAAVKMSNKSLPAEQMPGSLGFPYIGEAIDLFSTSQEFFINRFRDHGPAFKTQLFGKKYAVLVGPEANQAVLKDQASKLSSRLGWSLLEPLLVDGLILQDPPLHTQTRKLLYPVLNGPALEEYVELIQTQLSDGLDDWLKQGEIPLFRALNQMNLSVAVRLVLGKSSIEDVQLLSSLFLKFVAGLKTLLRVDVPVTAFGRACQARRDIVAYLSERIQTGTIDPQGILGQFLCQTNLPTDSIISQTIQILFGSHDTMARLLSWFVYELAQRPMWVNLLRSEVNQATGGGSQSLNLKYLEQLERLGWFLQEVERLYPPLHFIPRGVVEDIEVNGWLIPKGWNIFLSPLLTHRLPSLYPNSEVFNPERFAEQPPLPYQLIGFGGGSHFCLGAALGKLQMQLFAVKLLTFNWSVTPRFEGIVSQQSRAVEMLKLRLFSST
jgi:retinoid hydroxylase